MTRQEGSGSWWDTGEKHIIGPSLIPACTGESCTRSSLLTPTASNKLLPELDRGGLSEDWACGWMIYTVALLACLSCPEEWCISLFFNSLIELIRDGRACHIPCLNIKSSASAELHGKPWAHCWDCQAWAIPCWPIHSWTTLLRDGHTVVVWTARAAPCWLSFQRLDECNSTAQIFLACCLHEFMLKACFLKTSSFICLKCAVSIGCTCSQGYDPRVNMEKAQSQHHKCSFHGKCRQVYLYM